MKKTKKITKKQLNKLNRSAIKKMQAVELWRQTKGHISDICRTIGISRTTFYDWLKKDKEFANAIIDAEQELNDDVRDALIQKIADGDMTAIIFYLKKRHPDFQDRPAILQQFNVGGEMNVEFVKDEG